MVPIIPNCGVLKYITTLFRCQTYGLEIEAYFSTNRTVCKTEQFQFAVLNNSRIFLNHHHVEPIGLAKNTASTVAKLLIPNYANWKNIAIWTEPSFGTALQPLNVTG